MPDRQDTLAALRRVCDLRARLKAEADRAGPGAARFLRGPVDDELDLLEYLLGEENDRLATAEGLADTGEDIPRCLHCGCTEEQPCPGGCVWVSGPVDGDLCSRCQEELTLVAAALDDAAGYRDLRSSAPCKACASTPDGLCAEHQADESRAAAYRQLLAGRYSAYLTCVPSRRS
jgi:hypothetical protein